ncbi:MAG: CoA pyrophosphatase [Gammaproteobacteria bacterium]|nr:CoA pyrophosphatase [Gammaproteobacteria bacterium]
MDALLPGWVEALAAALDEQGDGLDAPTREALRRVETLASGQPAAASVLIAIVETAGGTGMLFTRRRDDIATHPGQVAFPGGAREGAESVERTALREAEEEVALPPEYVRVLGRLADYPTTSGYRVTPVVGYVPKLPLLRAQPGEVAGIFIVPLAVLLDTRRWKDRPLDFNGRRFPHRELLWEDQRIWGATAGMLRLLLPALGKAWGERP